MIATAAAVECGCNFIQVKGPELLNKYIGQSEQSVSYLLHLPILLGQRRVFQSQECCSLHLIL